MESWKHILTSNGKMWAHKMTPRTRSLGVPCSHLSLSSSLFTMWPVNLSKCVDACREILRLTSVVTCISLLEGENCPDSWWMITLEVRSRMIRVWYYWVCNIPREELWNTNTSRLGWPLSPPRKGIPGLFQQRNANKWENWSPGLYVNVVNGEGDSLSLGTLPAE